MTNKVLSVIKYVFLTIVSIISVFPLYYMLVSCSNETYSILSGKLLPGPYFTENLLFLVQKTIFIPTLFNSLRVAVVGTILGVILCSFAGYAFEIYHEKSKDRVMSVLLLSVMVPVAATLIPLFTLFGKFKLLNTTLGFVFPFISTAFLILLFRQSSRSFPRDIIDAARIDGLGEVKIFLVMYVPIMRPVFATATIVCFMQIWNDYLWALVVLQTEGSRTLPLLLSSMTDSYATEYGPMMMLATLTTLPLAIIFFFLQKNFTEGITGSVKG